jgi:hypothetical protein
MTYVITANGLICQFDEHRQMRGERDLQVIKNLNEKKQNKMHNFVFVRKKRIV